MYSVYIHVHVPVNRISPFPITPFRITYIQYTNVHIIYAYMYTVPVHRISPCPVPPFREGRRDSVPEHQPQPADSSGTTLSSLPGNSHTLHWLSQSAERERGRKGEREGGRERERGRKGEREGGRKGGKEREWISLLFWLFVPYSGSSCTHSSTNMNIIIMADLEITHSLHSLPI